MRTDELIAALSDNPAPVRPGAVMRTLALGLALGAAGSFLLMMTTIGMRHDLMQAMAGGPFWMKFGYTMALALLALWLVARAGRPGADTGPPARMLVLPLLAIAVLAAIQLMPGDADRHALMMGQSAIVCPWLIAGLAVPLFAGLFWAMRQCAPTRLTLAGAAAGLLAGSASASIYAFHCHESAAPFIAIWYTAGILVTTAVGTVLGRWVLRW